jgi:predicted metal-dependent enzyme (double-stranded beta helix superfamily)
VFDLDGFLSDLVDCLNESDSRRASREVLERALAAPEAVTDALAPPRGGINQLHHTPELTVINVAWAPKMQLMPHDHRMWALIGIYTGAEDNQFYRRADEGTIAETSGRRITTGEVCTLGTDTIHSVANPADRLTGAIHVYGGDFVNRPRSQWGPGERVEQPYDMAEFIRQFDDANLAAGLTAD